MRYADLYYFYKSSKKKKKPMNDIVKFSDVEKAMFELRRQKVILNNGEEKAEIIEIFDNPNKEM